MSTQKISPHTDKIAKGGEDAALASPTLLAVADGVGGWAEVGVDPSEFSNRLMRFVQQKAKSLAENLFASTRNVAAATLNRSTGVVVEPMQLLEYAYGEISKDENLEGSSTACIVVIQNQELKSANLGDSGFMVVRDGKRIFHSTEQIHSFNFPYQLGCHKRPAETPRDAREDKFAVKSGDVVVVGTDGLFDNLFPDEIIETLQAHSTLDAQQLAERLARRARDKSLHRLCETPFSREANRWGMRYSGGKPDDISVLVAHIS